MELEIIINDLEKIGEDLLMDGIKKIDCHLYGSILKSHTIANDIDILIIYEKMETLKIVKSKFNVIASGYPLHIICFTFCEEKELRFIEQQKAERIFSL